MPAIVSQIGRIGVALSVISIIAAPGLGGASEDSCPPHSCAISGMSAGHDTLSMDILPGEGCCPRAAKSPCCVAENGYPDQPSQWTLLEWAGTCIPPPYDGGAVTARADDPDGLRHPVCTSRFQWCAPPFRTYLLHQRFLI